MEINNLLDYARACPTANIYSCYVGVGNPADPCSSGPDDHVRAASSLSLFRYLPRVQSFAGRDHCVSVPVVWLWLDECISHCLDHPGIRFGCESIFRCRSVPPSSSQIKG